MQPETCLQLPPSFPAGDAALSLEWASGRGLEPVLWIGVADFNRMAQPPEFWTAWHLGAPLWVRFKRVAVLLNRVVFEAVELRPALDPAQQPQGVWWPLTGPRSQRPAATS